jgi:hypothetical protein
MIIEHRINSIELLQNVNKEHGIEIDVRWSDKLNKVIITHDYVCTDYVLLEDFLMFYNHKFLIINVKESQCEDKCIEIMKNFNIVYYFLDSQIPDIIRLYKRGYNNFIIRFSIFEEYWNLYKQFKYIWFDTFGNLENLDLLNFYEFKNNEFIFTSPELHGKNNIEEYRDRADVIKNICTKYPDIWKDILND